MDAIFLEVLNMSFTSSFVILAVIAMGFLLKKAPKKFSYILWSVVLFRLLCPFTFQSNLALLPVNPQPISQEIIYQTTPEISTGIVAVDDAVNSVLPPVTQPYASVNPIQIWIFAGRVLWIAGMVAMAIYSLVQYVLLKRKLSTAIPLDNHIYLADNIPSPFVLGLIRPKIYLPSHLESPEREYIIAHENCHLKRFDHITRVLAFIALTIHWFNPLVWLAFLLSERDMELSCDEAVMEELDADIRTDYAQSLLRLSTGRRLIAATPLAFGEGDTKGRIKNILNYKKSAFWVVILCTVIANLTILYLMCNPDEEKTPPEVPEIASILVSGDVITGKMDPLSPVIQTAMELVGKQVDYYTELGKEHDFVITQAEITGLEQVSTGTASESMEINLYKLEYRLTPDHIDNVPLVGGMSIDNGAITEWGSTGQPYLLFYSPNGDDGDEIFIEMTNTDTIFTDYGSDELLEEYGTAFTAYCMEWWDENRAVLAPDPRGITLSVTDVTSTGMTLVCNQSGGGEYYTGEDYTITRLENGIWNPLSANSDNWNDIAWNITPDGITEWELDWSYLYGDLEVGTYRLFKVIYSGKDATDKATYYVEFEVTEERIHPVYGSEFVNYADIL